MKIMIDTNVLISSALNRNGTPFKAFLKAVTSPNQAVICEQNIDEMRRVFNRKFPDKIGALESFLALSMLTLTVVPIPDKAHKYEERVRDIDDRPILRAAIAAKADIIVTGDLDLLEAELSYPKILTPAQFLEIK